MTFLGLFQFTVLLFLLLRPALASDFSELEAVILGKHSSEVVQKCKSAGEPKLDKVDLCWIFHKRDELNQNYQARIGKMAASLRPRPEKFRSVALRLKGDSFSPDVSKINEGGVLSIARILTRRSKGELERWIPAAISKDVCPNKLAHGVALAVEDKGLGLKHGAELSFLYQMVGGCPQLDGAAQESLLLRGAVWALLSGSGAQAESILRQSLAMVSPASARTLFWLAYAQNAQGKKSESSEVREKLYLQFPLSFHAALSTSYFDRDRMKNLFSEKSSLAPQIRSEQDLEADGLLEIAESLVSVGKTAAARKVLDWLVAWWRPLPPKVKVYLGTLKAQVSDYPNAISILAEAFTESPSLVSLANLEHYFARPYFELFLKNGKEIDPLLSLSVARRESAFNEAVISEANAVGLMQLVTAHTRVGKKRGRLLLLKPAENIRLGSRFLRMLVESQSGNVPKALAAYNAGPARVKRWNNLYTVDDIFWIELIPYRETREYVASVLRNYYWYHFLFPNPAQEGRSNAEFLFQQLTGSPKEAVSR